MVLYAVVHSLRMLDLSGQVFLVVVRSALLNLACSVQLSNIDWSVGLTFWFCFWSALIQAVLFGLVWSVPPGLFWSGSFGLYCSDLFSPVRSWQVLAGRFFIYPLLCWIRSLLICPALFRTSPVCLVRISLVRSASCQNSLVRLGPVRLVLALSLIHI